jgi:predicted CoA-binding protein
MNNICKILKESKNIAVVGISNKLYRDSRKIAIFLKDAGYNVVGVNPLIKEVGNILVYNSLCDIPIQIDIINVFRRSETIPKLTRDILLIKPKVLWLQLGIRNDEAVKPVIDAGIEVIQDKCIMIEYINCK